MTQCMLPNCLRPAEVLIAARFPCQCPHLPTYHFCLKHYRFLAAAKRFICSGCGRRVTTISEPVPL